MDLVFFDEVLGPLVMEYMSFPDVQRLSITSRAYSTLKNVTARHSEYWKYLHNRQMLKFMKTKSNENKKQGTNTQEQSIRNAAAIQNRG